MNNLPPPTPGEGERGGEAGHQGGRGDEYILSVKIHPSSCVPRDLV